MISAWKIASTRFDSRITTSEARRARLSALTQPVLRSKNANFGVCTLNFEMKPIGDAVDRFDPAMQAPDIAGQSGGLLVKRANIRNHSGDQIARVLTISSLRWFTRMRTFVLLLVIGASA